MNYKILSNVNSIQRLLFISSRHCSKVPLIPVPTLERLQKQKIEVNTNTIALLERLSLVKFDTKEGVEVLKESIAFADKILHINTDNVQPLFTVLENENLSLREDEITDGNCQADVLRNAVLKEDHYFVAPPGNIPLHEITSEEENKQRLEEGSEIEQKKKISKEL